MAVVPADIAVALGRTAPEAGSPTEAQWAMWITDAEMLIETRRLQVDDTLVIDQAKRDYVVREAVVAQVRRPDDSMQVTKAVDDGSVTKLYRSSAGRVSILDEWWTLLGLASVGGGAFDVSTVGYGTVHADWCSINFGATYCSCGADIAGYPIFGEGSVAP